MLSYKTLTSFKTCPIVPVQDPLLRRIPACPSGGSSNEYLMIKTHSNPCHRLSFRIDILREIVD